MAVIDSLIVYYALDEASGAAIDAHSTHDMTETGGTIASTTGKVGNARDFENTDLEHFEVASHADLVTGDIDFTVAGWVNMESAVTGAILAKYNGGAGSEYWLGYASGSARFAFNVRDAANTVITSRAATAFGAPTANGTTWYFVIGWHDATANTLNIQVNNSTVETTASYTAGVFAGTEALRIAAVGAPGATCLDGLIDEVGFWKKVLTSDERTWLYNAGAGRSYADIVAEAASGMLRRHPGMDGGFRDLTGRMNG